MLTPTLTPEELVDLTGYRKPGHQLAELHRRGYWRATRGQKSGRVILERPHFDAVSRGADPAPQAERPRLRGVPQLRAA